MPKEDMSTHGLPLGTIFRVLFTYLGNSASSANWEIIFKKNSMLNELLNRSSLLRSFEAQFVIRDFLIA